MTPQPLAYVRFQARRPSPSGRYPGVFALANGLAHGGKLSPEDWAWWRSNNDWFEATATDPATVDPTVFDRTRHPHTSCWFKGTATHLLDRVPGYLRLLTAYGVEWVELRSEAPGLVIYEDDVQIVVAQLHRPEDFLAE